jgi:hypothetical protein
LTAHRAPTARRARSFFTDIYARRAGSDGSSVRRGHRRVLIDAAPDGLGVRIDAEQSSGLFTTLS